MSKIAAIAKPSASILLVRDGEAGLEVLMTKRAGSMAFAPDALVFPGGKVEEADRDHALWAGHVNIRHEEGTDDFGFRMAAVRELYEETAILFTDGLCPANASSLPFRECVRLSQNRLNLAGLVYFAHWVTPETMKLRFDTHFYLAPYNGDTYCHDGSEAVSLMWDTPGSFLAGAESGSISMMFPTRMNLVKLARAGSVTDALRMAQEAPVVRIMPVMREDGPVILPDPADTHGTGQGAKG